MRTRLLVLAPALLLPLALTACSDDGDQAADPAGGTTTSPAATSAGTDAGEAAGGSCQYVVDGSQAAKPATVPPATPEYSGKVAATLTMSIGKLDLTLDADKAPCTVNSFLSLVKQGYYDGTPCHRMTVSETFKVLQCGDPSGTGMGGPGYTIPDEYDGTETYPAGTLAMARTQAPNTGGSQVFVVFGDTQLAPEYTVFGTVDQAGVDAIVKAARAGVTPAGAEDGAPKTPISIEKATVK